MAQLFFCASHFETSSVPVLQQLSAQLKYDTTHTCCPATVSGHTHSNDTSANCALFDNKSHGLYIADLFLGLFDNAFSVTQVI
jgi:hypothetical protein